MSKPDVHRRFVSVFRVACAVLLAVGALLAADAQAAKFVEKSFDQLVQESEQIFVGTCVGATSRLTGGGAIVTDYRFDLETALKGTSAGSFVFTSTGGTYGGRTLRLPGVPHFDEGARYVLFVAGNGRVVFPAVGGDAGVMKIVRDPATGTDKATDWQGGPLKRQTADAILGSVAGSTGDGVPLSAVLEAVRDRLGR